jgi:hypothetical protein
MSEALAHNPPHGGYPGDEHGTTPRLLPSQERWIEDDSAQGHGFCGGGRTREFMGTSGPPWTRSEREN